MESSAPSVTPSPAEHSAATHATRVVRATHATRVVRATVIFNPTAGHHHSDVAATEVVLKEHGWSVCREQTSKAGDGTRLARAAAARGDDVVVVAGGDGTVNEAIQGLAGTSTALGVLPMGTTNVWAREVKLPTDPVAAARALIDGDHRAMDLGRAGDRYFLLMAGLGFDAAVTNAVSMKAKRVLGRVAYGLTIAMQAMRYQGPEVTLEMDDATVRCPVLLVIAGNTRLYGGNFSATAAAVADDGLLDVAVFQGRRLWDIAPRALPLLLGRRPTPASPFYYRTRRLRVTAPEALPVQVDGDYMGTPFEITIAPAALRVIVPRGTGSGLFGQPPLAPSSGDTDAP